MNDDNNTVDKPSNEEKQTTQDQNTESNLSPNVSSSTVDSSDVNSKTNLLSYPNYDVIAYPGTFSPVPIKKYKVGIIGLSITALISILICAGLILLIVFKFQHHTIGLVLCGIGSFTLLAIFIYSITFLILAIIHYRHYKKNNTIECDKSQENTSTKPNNMKKLYEIRDIYTIDDVSLQNCTIQMTQSHYLLPTHGCFPTQPFPVNPNSHKLPPYGFIPSPAMHPPPSSIAGFYCSESPPPMTSYDGSSIANITIQQTTPPSENKSSNSTNQEQTTTETNKEKNDNK